MKMESTQEMPTKARPGRPRSEQKRDAILGAAGHLFLENGLDRTSMDSVAQRASVSKQTVYSHFSSKEDLVFACVRYKLESYALDEAGVDEALSLRDGLVLLCSRYLSLLYDGDVVRMYRTILGSVATHPDVARLFYEAGPRAGLGTFLGFVERHQQAGRLVAGDVQEAAEMLMGMLVGQAHMRSLLGVDEVLDERAREARAERCVDAFLQLYGADTKAREGMSAPFTVT